ncbi:DUF7507 domain-containing protein [Nonomuraea terrae]|uniref:DUF7507 domain-containing protein n=1 Tax=Nonomuraea terrae TaxID=2530383 RepID=UPI003CCC7605
MNAGDTVVWQIMAHNTGRTPLENLTVSDPAFGEVTCPATTLAPGARTICTTAPYTITRKDAKKGKIVNVATVSATGTDGRTVTSRVRAKVAVRPPHRHAPRR